MRKGAISIASLGLAMTACNQNTALGNDREAWIDGESTASPIAAPQLALANVSGTLLKPETMSDADIAAIGGREGRCAIKLTEVGFPSFLFEPGGTGYLKMNGKLIPIFGAGEGRFSEGGLLVTVRTLSDEGNAGLQAADMIVVAPDAEDEIGYRGYIQCFDGAAA